jgi:hypothetical protein
VGSVGFTGSKGDTGSSVQITGYAASAGELPLSYTGNVGDGYLTQDNGNLHVWMGSGTWLNVGQIQGPQGFTGSGGNGGGGVSFGNYDGGEPDSIYGGISPLDAGGVV